MGRLIDDIQIVEGFAPVDLQTAANDGDWVSLENFNGLLIIFHKKAGTAGDDPTLTLEQATAVAGTAAKALTFTRIYTKQGAALNAVGLFTEVTQTAAATYTDATSAEVAAIWAVEINATDLDVNGGFDCVRARVADVGGNAQLGSLLYILHGGRYGNVVSGIID